MCRSVPRKDVRDDAGCALLLLRETKVHLGLRVKKLNLWVKIESETLSWIILNMSGSGALWNHLKRSVL